MAVVTQEAINQLEVLITEAGESLNKTFQNVHQGYPHETFARFLKAREGNVPKAHKMLVDSFEWRVQNDIDNMLAKPIVPVELYRGIRDSYPVGLSGYSNEGLPVFAVGVGLSTFDKASSSEAEPFLSLTAHAPPTYGRFDQFLRGALMVEMVTADLSIKEGKIQAFL